MAPEVRGDPHWRRRSPRRTHSDLPGALRPAAIAAFLFAFAAIFVHFAQDNVRTAEAVFRPWTEGRLPLFALDSLDGERSDLARPCRGAMLVHFFATWCEPCRAELSALQQLQNRLRDGLVTDGLPKDRSLQIIGVDAGETDNRVRRFFAERPVSFPILLDRERAMSKAGRSPCCRPHFCSTAIWCPASRPKATSIGARREVEADVMTFIRQQGGAGEDDCAF
jgi:hypothetical protein